MANEIFYTLSEREQGIFLLGAICYKDDTEDGKRAISISKLREYSKANLYSLLDYLFLADGIDFEKDSVAFETLNNLHTVLQEIDPITISPDEVDKRYKEFLAMLADRSKENAD